MKTNPVNWFEIYVNDMNRAKKFYESVFEGKLSKIGDGQPEMWGFPGEMNVAGAAGSLVKMDGFEAGRNSVLVYFSCTDCAVEEKKAVQFGGRIQRPKMSIGEYGFVSLVVDSEGNMIGLHSLA